MDTKPNFDLKERTKAFALRMIAMFVKLPKTDVARVLGRQVLRSGTSVGANYREADEARSKAEFVSKMGDSLKELSETEYWLELLIESQIVKTEKNGRSARRNTTAQAHLRHHHPQSARHPGTQVKAESARHNHWSLEIGHWSFPP